MKTKNLEHRNDVKFLVHIVTFSAIGNVNKLNIYANALINNFIRNKTTPHSSIYEVMANYSKTHFIATYWWKMVLSKQTDALVLVKYSY